MTKLLSLSEAQNIIQEIRNAYDDIPFGNTAFQTEMFVIASQITPARAYRSIGLQLFSLVEELKRLAQETELNELKIEENQKQINNQQLTAYEQKKLEQEIVMAQDRELNKQKEIKDKLHELSILYRHFKLMPKYTREQFESQERLFYEQSLQRQALGVVGAREAILNMTEDIRIISEFEKLYQSLPAQQKDELLEQITKQAMSLPEQIGKEQTNAIQYD